VFPDFLMIRAAFETSAYGRRKTHLPVLDGMSFEGRGCKNFRPCIRHYDLLCYKHIGGPGSSVGRPVATELRTERSGDRIPVERDFSNLVQTDPV
jgi:hypothetical protein